MSDPTLFDLDPVTHARRTDPDTSRAAATRLRDQRTMMRALLSTFVVADRTCEEAALVAGYDPEKASKRVSDLRNLGYLVDTDARRQGRSGREQIVRRITLAGRRALQ